MVGLYIVEVVNPLIPKIHVIPNCRSKAESRRHLFMSHTPAGLKPCPVFVSVFGAPDILLAAGDGYVIEFARDGADWIEKRRWNSWAGDAASTFGSAIYITTDDGRLWVADCVRHRVVCLNPSSGKLIATFGAADKKGADSASLSTPQSIAARGRRAVVFDSDNQRLVKLRLR